MRPRRVRLGCPDVLLETDLVGDASMRPRRVRLGCRERQAAEGARRDRFNEAEARAPRMLALGLRHGSGETGASMRPRRVRLGCTIGLALNFYGTAGLQ